MRMSFLSSMVTVWLVRVLKKLFHIVFVSYVYQYVLMCMEREG